MEEANAAPTAATGAPGASTAAPTGSTSLALTPALDVAENGGPTPCCICMEVEDYNGSAMVRCARCNISVHVRCYGVSVSVVGGDLGVWHCQACQYMLGTATGALLANTTSPPRLTPQCAVCPVAGGALRLTNQRDVWCHALCINWVPELYHSLAGEMDEAVEIGLLDRSRSSLRCLVCGLRGGCIQCVSGRCAKPFHVLCAFRSPSSLIFTGYNKENQQVYHCKSHLSDVSTRRYEMVDNSWRKLPAVIKFVQEHAPVDGKCRFCNTKAPVAAARELHETQCLLSWLTREDDRRRKEEIKAVGVKPAEIAYARKSSKSKSLSNSKSGPGRKGRPSEDGETANPTSKRSGKQKRHPMPMRPCPECGESIRETLMMGHLRNTCPRSRHAGGKARGSKLKRKGSPTASMTGAGFAEEMEAIDMTDVLFASWPGQNSGAPMDSTHLWKVVNGNFFNSKMLQKKRVEQLCKTLCGVKLEDITKSSRRRPSLTDLHCRDTIRLERKIEDPRLPLVLQKVVHRCDFLMRASHGRCMSDSAVKPVLEIAHSEESSQEPVVQTSQTTLESVDAEIRVLFSNVSDDTAVACKYSMQLARNGTLPEHMVKGGTFSSSFQHDAISTLSGAELQSKKLPLGSEDRLLISLDACDAVEVAKKSEEPEPQARAEAVTETTAAPVAPELSDELTPAINLLLEHLKHTMEQNRYTLRTLSKKQQAAERHEIKLNIEARTTEMFYREFSSWKRLCASLLIGYRASSQRDGKALAADATKEDGEADGGGETEDEDDAIDDGTCVVCFDGQSPESNPIVFCDRCELAVHQRCYGIAKVPSSEFICDRCRVEREGLDPATAVFCQLCSLADGAFKRTVDGKWVHVVCALWCPKVWIGNLFELSDINLVGNSGQARFVNSVAEVDMRVAQASGGQVSVHKPSPPEVPALELGSLCMHCRVACGRTIQCCHPGCTASFHPLCGWFAGLPMTISRGDHGFMYAGGGAGLDFRMFCSNHFPDDYSPAEQLAQRRRRGLFRIDSYFVLRNQSNYSSGAKKQEDGGSSLLSGSIVQAVITAESKMAATNDDEPQKTDWTDMAVCSACFEYCAPVVGELTDVNLLHRRQFMIRCQYCNIYIHPECCISEIGSSASIFRSNWICERCTLTGDKEAPGCVVCEKSTDYLMPCITPVVSNPSAAGVAVQPPPASIPLSMAVRPAPGGGQQLWLGHAQSLPRQQLQQQQQPNREESNGTTASTASNRWIHVYCSKWKKTKTVKKNHMLCAYSPALSSEGVSTRCELCYLKEGLLVNCSHCYRRFHPICAAKKKLFCARSNRAEWKFYCEAHPPLDAAFDENRQMWITQEILSQLQDLRRSLERGRMLLEMSRQRDRQQKRLLNFCQLPLMEATVDVVVKKHPTPQMKAAYLSATGEALTDVPSRPKPKPNTPPAKSRSRSKRSASSNSTISRERPTPQRSSTRVAAASRPTRSTSKRPAATAATPEKSPKRRRVRADSGASTASSADTRRSSRRKVLRYSQTTLDDAMMDDGKEDDAEGGTRAAAALKEFLAGVVVPTDPTDFDTIVPQQYPNLVD